MAEPRVAMSSDAQEPTRRGSGAPRWPRSVFSALSPAGRAARLTILNFHRVGERPDPLYPNEMHAAVFRERMRWVREWFAVQPLDVAIDALARGALPARALAITFDDGYADNATIALPILRELGLHATFFVTTGFLDGGRMWNDTVIESIRRCSQPYVDLGALGFGLHSLRSTEARRAAIDALLIRLKRLHPLERAAGVEAIAAASGCVLPDDLMMTAQQVRTLASGGMGVGAHTMTHPILTTLDEAASREEIVSGRAALEGIVGRRVALFAYPNGRPDLDYRKVHVELVNAAGFSAALSTAPGAAGTGSSLLELPRFTPWDATALRWAARLAHNYVRPIARAQT